MADPHVQATPEQDKSSLVQSYLDRGLRLIFYPTKQKGPSGAEAVGWTERSDGIVSYKGQNVGTFTGVEISPTKYLADIDFDWADGLPLARHILPVTGFGFGRTSRMISHAFYTTPHPVISRAYDGLDGRPIVEIRGTKTDGTIGMQTMLPPSVHPSGEDLVLRQNGEIGHSEDLERRVLLYAIACLLDFTNHSFTHDARLATAGFLLSEGLTPEETLLIGSAICDVSGNNAGDFKTLLGSTLSKIKQGDRVQGKSALIKILGDTGKVTVSRVKEWLGNEEFVMDSKGKIIPNHQDNVRMALEKIGVGLTFDIFAQKPLFEREGSKGTLIDSMVTETWLEIDDKFGFRPAKDFYYDVVQNISNKNKYHPVLDYLSSLKWDGVPRVDEWIIRAGQATDTPYVRAVSSIFLIAAVKRVSHPGCKYDEMVVLESSQQGLMKSTALRTLCPDEAWFSDDLPLNVDAKQIVERTLGKWIIEASDLSGMNKSMVEHLKGMLSRQVDGPVRMAYGRLPVEQKRQFVIIGTTNANTYLTDSTGNRRFWPVQVKKFDIDWIKENRDQLWAEAYARAVEGESIRLDPSLYESAAMQQERRRSEDPWESVLEGAFPRNKMHRLIPEEVWCAVGFAEIGRRDETNNARLLKVMHRLGFRRLTVRRNGVVLKGFGRDADQLEMPDEEEG